MNCRQTRPQDVLRTRRPAGRFHASPPTKKNRPQDRALQPRVLRPHRALRQARRPIPGARRAGRHQPRRRNLRVVSRSRASRVETRARSSSAVVTRRLDSRHATARSHPRTIPRTRPPRHRRATACPASCSWKTPAAAASTCSSASASTAPSSSCAAKATTPATASSSPAISKSAATNAACCCSVRHDELTRRRRHKLRHPAEDERPNYRLTPQRAGPCLAPTAVPERTHAAPPGSSTPSSAPAPKANRAHRSTPPSTGSTPVPRTTQALAVDVPSGLDCDTGQPAAHTVRADHTCTFAAMKIGFTATRRQAVPRHRPRLRHRHPAENVYVMRTLFRKRHPTMWEASPTPISLSNRKRLRRQRRLPQRTTATAPIHHGIRARRNSSANACGPSGSPVAWRVSSFQLRLRPGAKTRSRMNWPTAGFLT